MRVSLCLLSLVAALCPAGNVFFIDPVHGSADGDGSATAPWRTLQEVYDDGLIETQAFRPLPYDPETSVLTPLNPGAPVQPGDTILLLSGDQGYLHILEAQNTETITVAAAPGHTPIFRGMRLTAIHNWEFRGLTVTEPAEPMNGLIFVETHGWRGPSSHVVIDDCDVSSVDDATGWTADDWDQLSSSGIRVSATDVTVRHCRLRNVDFGITASGDRILVEHCEVDSFAGDGMRALGDDVVMQFNTIKNCCDVNDNHDDGIQSWTTDGVPLHRIILRGNTIIESEDPDRPLRGHLQGIGCFDGMFEDWVVENNAVMVSHYHGITLSGARRCRVINNTAVDPEGGFPCWIRIGNHKDGTESEDCVVRNNISAHFSIEGVLESHEVDHNLDLEDPAAVFMDHVHLDVRLREGSPAIDAGSPDLAPDHDIRGLPRPQGEGDDIGAFEFLPLDSGMNGLNLD